MRIDEGWRRRARCRTILDPDVFFVSDEEHKPKKRKTQVLTKMEEIAVQVCDTCPVSGNCLLFALDDPRLVGIWGGTTTEQRRALRRTRTRMSCPRCARGLIMQVDNQTQACMNCGLSWLTE